MDFKKLFTIFITALALSACDGNGPLDDEFKVGPKLENISDLNTPYAGARDVITVYDSTIKKIHQFDLNTMKSMRALKVRNPEKKHYLLYSQNGNYIIDFTDKHITIFDKNSKAVNDPIRFLGKPISASFRPELGLLVVYDDLSTVGIIKLDSSGKVLSSWVSGPILDPKLNKSPRLEKQNTRVISTDPDDDHEKDGRNDRVITSGDLDYNGNLILSLRDGDISIVNIEETLAAQKWVYTSFNSGLNLVSWVSPVRSNKDYLLFKVRGSIGILDLKKQKVISKIKTYNQKIIKFSRTIDPHIVTKSWSETKIYYVEGSKIVSRSFFNKEKSVTLISHLNLKEDSLLLVSSKGVNKYSYYNNINLHKSDRQAVKYRFSDGLALISTDLPNDTELKLSKTYAFALYPSELGYAKRIDLKTNSETVIKHFNLDHIKRNP